MLENILFSMNSTMPLFFIMLLGYVLHRTGFLSDAFVAGANKFVFYVALPVQLFRDLGKNDVRATFDGRYVLFCFAVTLACILVIWALAKLFLKGTGLVGEFVQVCYRSSAAILGSAFLLSIYESLAQHGWKSCNECKRISQVDCETDGSSRDESRS